ncbi:MAG TPA: hypothetical protein VJK31_15050 [Chthoniobacterales bacterium]|nr:hypothetical protein [Chthoniobacterales bacterium]
MKFAALTLLLALSVCPICRAQADQQEVKHHGMMHAMDARHLVSETAKLSVSNSAAANELTLRVGPVNLPAHTDPMAVAQPPVFFLTIPFDGWLTAFHPRLANSRGHSLPNKLLHHAAFYDTERTDFLCPKSEEHIFGAGTEMSDWPAIPGFGYRVKKGDRIRISTMFANPTSKNYPDAFFEVRIDYHIAQSSSNAATLKDIYPAWFDVMGCGKSAYDLPSGQSTRAGEFKLRFSGRLLAVGGHLHDYGEWLVLKDPATNETIVSLAPQLDPSGRISSIPIVLFADRGGFAVRRGDLLEVTDAYNNPTGKSMPGAAMGIVVGYFLPDDPAAFSTFGHQPHH